MAQKKRGGKSAAKGSGASWQGTREGLRPSTIGLIALAGLVAIVGGYLLQRSGLLRADSSAETASTVRINELMSENVSTLITDTGDVPDWIEISNTGSEAVEIGKYTLLLGSNVNQMLSFPDYSLAPGECLLIHADGGASGRWSAPFKLPASGGDTLVLMNASGRAVDSVKLPELDADAAYARAADGSWSITMHATPGADNASSAAVTGLQLHEDALEITEVMASNGLYFPDEYGELHDYVEIHNKSDGDVNLSGWYLSDSSDRLKRWSFPNVNLPAGGYLAVHCSGYNRKTDSAHLHTDFKLSSDGESIYLSRPEGQTVSMVSTPVLAEGQAYSLVDGAWTASFAPTPGMANDAESAAYANAQLFGDRSNALRINEIMASPTQQACDWVEIYNGSNQAVDLSGCGLSDALDRPRKWQFPAGTTLHPGQYLIVCLPGANGDPQEDYLNANFALSSEGGDTVCLADTKGRIIDAVYLPKQYGGLSYGRAQGQIGFFYFESGTPGPPNTGASYRSRAAEPVCSVQGGLFQSGQSFQVELSAPAGSRIYYTLDCSDPDQSATLYTGPISVSSTTILRSRVYRDGALPSLIDTQSYLFDVQNVSNVYVVSLVSDMENLSSPESGIMVEGYNNNFMQDWEREAHVELFSADGQNLISQGCGISLHGMDSRKLPIKSFNVIARSEYGENRFRYPIFSDRDYQEYQSILLRPSGEDYDMSFMRDTLLSTLMEDTSVMYQEYEIAIVYLDGQYYTLCYIRERINKHSICQFEGWEGMEDQIDVIRGNSSVVTGSNRDYKELLEWIQNNDTTTQAAYDYIASQIDIQNYIEYRAMEIFSGNADTLNLRRYRNPMTDGKWRWALYDLDWAFYLDRDTIGEWITPGGAGASKATDNTLFVGCMRNPIFRDQFMTYMGQQLATNFSTANILNMIDERLARIEGVLPQYLEQWDLDLDSGINKIRNYAKTRPAKLLAYIQDAYDYSEAEMMHYFGDAIAQIQSQNTTGGESDN